MVCVFEALEREWGRLAGDRAAARRLGDVCLVAGGARSLAEVEGFVRGAGPADADRVLVALVDRASVHGRAVSPGGPGAGRSDELAARVLLQLLLPGTRSLARRWWALGDHDERAAAAVAAVYHRIRTYPAARRPARVAANVLLDAAQELRRSVPRVVTLPSPDPMLHRTGAHHRAGGSPGYDHDGGHDHDGAPNPAVELAEVLRDAVHEGVVPIDDARLIAGSRIAGQRIADLATHRGLRPRTLWDRRQRAEHALVAAHRAS